MLAGAVQSSWSEAPLRNVLAHQRFLRNQEQDSELVLPLEVLCQQSASVQASFQTKSLQCDLGSSFAISSLEEKKTVIKGGEGKICGIDNCVYGAASGWA